MKKFLKAFSVFVLVCCCMFSFAGCNVFQSNIGSEYAGLVNERKVVRNVVDNTKEMLTSNIESEKQPVGQSSEISAQNDNEDVNELVETCEFTLKLTCAMLSEIINANDFVPGKLYNFILLFDEGYETYCIANAYCGEQGVVILNLWMSFECDMDTSTFLSIDIYYNEQYKATKLILYSHEYEDYGEDGNWEDFCVEEMRYSTSGELEYYRMLNRGTDYEDNWRILENGEYKEYLGEEITAEMYIEFELNMDINSERTSLFSYARPLPQSSKDKINEIYKGFIE